MILSGSDTGPAWSADQDIYDEARHWTYRIARASLGTSTGLIVLAMLAKVPRLGPAVLGTADILPNGNVVATIREACDGGMCKRKQVIGNITAVRDNMRRLADHCRLSDADREAMFEELRKWIRKDHRARSEN